jgi:enoyl-CoA hydratase
MVAAMTSPVSFELFGTVAVIRIDDGKANALSPAVLDALGAALDRAEKEAKAVALFGRPGRFSAGFDLKVMMSSPDAAKELVGRGGELFLRLFLHPQPVVIGVTGHALAGGVLLAACGDVRIGARGDFKLGLNEIQIGLPVPILAHELARARLDTRKLTEATLLATIYDPEQALAVGWLDRLSAAESLEADVLAEATRLSAFTGPHYALTKQTLRGEAVAYIRRTSEENLRQFASLKA